MILFLTEAPWGLSDKLGWKQPAAVGSRLFPLGGGGARRVRDAAPFAAGCRNALGNSAAAGRAYGRRRPRRGRPADGPGAGPQDGGSASAAAVRSSGRGMRATARVRLRVSLSRRGGRGQRDDCHGSKSSRGRTPSAAQRSKNSSMRSAPGFPASSASTLPAGTPARPASSAAVTPIASLRRRTRRAANWNLCLSFSDGFN